MINLVNTIEAIVFASGCSIKRSDIMAKLPPEVTKKEFDGAVKALESKYSGESGILFLTVDDKLQFSSNPQYSALAVEILTPLKEKSLTTTLLEVMAIIAYKQPITRLEIAEIRGTEPDYALAVLQKVNLIEVTGRKNAVGRPSLYGTTEEFLKKFQLHDISELPDFQTIMEQLQTNFNVDTESLYRDIKIANELEEQEIDRLGQVKDIVDLALEEDENEIPEFLGTEEYQVVE
ncbi:MAG: SMC-Scp complex subunit ScpB [Clostridia bacterium]